MQNAINLFKIQSFLTKKNPVMQLNEYKYITRLIIYVKIKLFTAIYSNKNKITQKLFFVCLS